MAPGATVSVYCLHDCNGHEHKVASFTKKLDTMFQPPGCYNPNTNGIKLHAFFEVPIEQSQLSPSYLEGWDQAVVDIKQHLNPASADAAEEEQKVNFKFSEARNNASGMAVRQLQFEVSMSEASESEMDDSDDN